jgi:cell division protein FtsI/penicillin-binding protein 2
MNIKNFFKNFFTNWRIFFILLLFFSFSLVIISRFFNLQIVQREKFEAEATNQISLNQNKWERLRGKIYFQEKGGNLIPMAINKDFKRVFAVPDEISEPEKTAQLISEIFDISKEILIKNFSKKGDLYELIAKKVEPQLAEEVNNLQLKGIYIDEEVRRFYPNENIASHILGFIRDDDINAQGQYGLEKQYNNKLGTKETNDFLGILSLRNAIFGRKNYDLICTIDFNIQKKAEKLLENKIKDEQAEKGSIVVLEPSTGKILAMANFPNFNPNKYFEYSLSDFPNPIVELTYEPGSTFKIFTVAAGLESKKISPSTTYGDKGKVEINGKIITNWDLKAHGIQTISEILEKSLNTGVVFIEQLLGHDLFYYFINQFSVAQKTDIDLPGEVEGNINNLKGFQDIYFATASFGQGIATTPIGLLSSISAIANNGIVMKPYIVEKIVNIQNGNEKITEPEIKKRIMEQEIARIVRIMLINAVEKNYLAKIPGYQIAGKTGTAQVPDKQGKYSEKDTIHSFVGFAPAQNPKFIILVKIDKPQKSKFAGSTAIPVFKELAKYILNYYEILPD